MPFRCHGACDEWEDVLTLLTSPDDLPPILDYTPPTSPFPEGAGPQEDLKIPFLGETESAALVLKGRANEALRDLPSAVECYKEALSCDIYCAEALDRLCQQHALTKDEEASLMAALPFSKQCSKQEEEMIKFLYVNKFQHRHAPQLPSLSERGAWPPPPQQGPSDVVTPQLEVLPGGETAWTLPPLLKGLTSSVDVMSGVANSYWQQMNVRATYDLTSALLDVDPYHAPTLLLHVACCVQRNSFEELFSLGHTLVNSAPGSSLSWYVVGCYYIAINRHQNARKYLTKALTLEPNFGHAHIAYGLSLAAEGEHDQAISAFSQASRSMRGSHLPFLYLGKEYHLTGIINTSTRFMKSAYNLSPHDPQLLQEIGYVVFGLGAYPKAERYFRAALVRLKAVDPHLTLQAWEPVYNNLGHALRKQGKLDEALQAHRHALQLDPANPSTLTALAFVQLLRGDFEGVVSYANQSLRLKREEQFTLEVLHAAMQEIGETPFCLGPVPDLDSMESGGGDVAGKMVLRSESQLLQDAMKEPCAMEEDEEQPIKLPAQPP